MWGQGHGLCGCHGGRVSPQGCAATERTAPRGPNMKGSLGDEVSAVGADRREAVRGAGAHGKPLCLPLHFAATLKLSYEFFSKASVGPA